MTTIKLPDHASAQACIAISENERYITLRSYSTTVVIYDRSTGCLYCTGTYSATTRKHIGWFCKWLNNHANTYTTLDATYQLCKRLYENTAVAQWDGCTFRYTPITGNSALAGYLQESHYGNPFNQERFEEVTAV